MSKDLSRTAQKFLAELGSDPAFTTVSEFIELLEEKEDPDPIELRLIESLYAFNEKLKLLENGMRTYVKKIRENLPGSKLQDLYDDTSYNGAGSIFKD
jgi:hypothetical protein